MNFPDNFHQSRSPGYKFERFFQWVVKEPILHDFYLKRAIELLGDNCTDLDSAKIFTCGCGAHFKRCIDYIQHRKSTNHPRPGSGACCDGCARGGGCADG
mmetsp:Transcript_19503/g.30560  ORF Transcript_19503/g.30560 Transcript_19503/m.30560 type:complete len:100 (-) Transcript_19503:66-365(-)